MFDDHTITLERPRLDTKQAWFRARCSCGWSTSPTYTRGYQEKIAGVHLAGVRDKALEAELLAAADRGETISISAWREAHPLPPALPA